MTSPELVDFRKELVQTAAVIVSALEDIDFGEANTERYLGWHNAHSEHGILREIWEERRRQDLKWGPQHHRIADWLAIIGEEYGEACMAYVDDLLMPTILEQKRIGLNSPKPVRWGKADLADYGTPTTAHDYDSNVKTMERLFDNRKASDVQEKDGGPRPPIFIDRDDDDHDPNEGRFERQD